jgi:F-type H+-transporting ATPase subunit delta
MQTVTVTTASKLSSKQVETLSKAIEKKYGTSIKLVQLIEPEIIGGIKVRIGSQELDASLKTKLVTIQQRLMMQL